MKILVAFADARILPLRNRMSTVAKTAAVPSRACVATPGAMPSKTREMPPTSSPSNAA